MDFSEMMKQSIPEAHKSKRHMKLGNKTRRKNTSSKDCFTSQSMRTTIDDILKQNQNLLSTFSPKKEKKEESALDRLANEEQIEREEKTNHYLEKILESLIKIIH